MGVFSLVRGTPGGSPYDPSDSIVIPLGVSVAILVWVSSISNNAFTRTRLSLLVAVVAAVASVATSSESHQGITAFELDDHGNVVGYSSGPVRGDERWVTSKRAVTPRGTFQIRGHGIYLTRDGQPETKAFSTTFVAPWIDQNALAAATRDIGPRTVSVMPKAIYYEESTESVLVAMGLQGLVVGLPDGRWVRKPVGNYRPLDFSPFALLGRMFGYADLFFIGAGITVTLIGFTAIIVGMPTNRTWRSWILPILAIFPMLSVSFAFLLFSNQTSDVGFFGDAHAAIAVTSICMTLLLWFVSSTVNRVTRPLLVGAVIGSIGALALFYLAFLLWIAGLVTTETAKIIASAMLIALAATLGFWVRNKHLEELETEHSSKDE